MSSIPKSFLPELNVKLFCNIPKAFPNFSTLSWGVNFSSNWFINKIELFHNFSFIAFLSLIKDSGFMKLSLQHLLYNLTPFFVGFDGNNFGYNFIKNYKNYQILIFGNFYMLNSIRIGKI